MRFGAFPVALAGVAALSMVVLAQQPSTQPPPPSQQPTFKSGTQVVSLFVTVADAQKRLVPGLTQEDFEVYDNDKPQPIVYFDNSVRPINVVVMLDTSGSMTLTIDLLKRAAEQFVIRLLPEDKGRVGAFNDKVQISSRFTSDRDELVSSVKDVDFGNSTRLWDGVAMGLEELKTVDGRRVVLVFTDGDDTDSRTNLGTVVERARADETMVYAIGLESNYFNGQRYVKSKPDRGLKRLADETGGGYFELEKTSDLAPTFTKVAAELHSQYVIGFAPTQLDGRVHKLAVKMKQPGLAARARRSYVAAPDKFSVSEK
jgi:Ca-activated chloride channel family protein